MYEQSTQRMVKSRSDGCPRCGEELAVALPGSVDTERVCVCRSCSTVVTYGDVDVNGMSEAQALCSVPLSHRLPVTA